MKGTKYDAAFKKQAIAMVNEGELSVVEVADKLGIHIKTIYRWLDEFKQECRQKFKHRLQHMHKSLAWILLD